MSCGKFLKCLPECQNPQWMSLCVSELMRDFCPHWSNKEKPKIPITAVHVSCVCKYK